MGRKDNLGRVVISGGTGFIGRSLAATLADAGYEAVVLTRNPRGGAAPAGNRIRTVGWDGRTADGWLEAASGAFGLVNLAGENIGAARWTRPRKKKLVSSRLETGRAVMEAIEKSAEKPRCVIQASAVGYYGPRGDEELDETASSGRGFLAGLARDWEDSTAGAAAFGVRRVVIRSGLVLHRDGGVLPRFLRPYRFLAGGPLGSGRQWVS
jgi:uncharacterized protein (TIGR01777 family)